jgi:serine/threonine-protein kinase
MTDARDHVAAALADQYLIEQELGRGASATVYLTQDLRHGRQVALKVLHAALGSARFQREIRTQARLHHPHILPLFDSGSTGERLYYSMPFVEQGSLRDRLRRTGPLGLAAVRQLGTEVGSALGYAHALGIVHRDLKPENIMLSPSGHAILGFRYRVRHREQEWRRRRRRPTHGDRCHAGHPGIHESGAGCRRRGRGWPDRSVCAGRRAV